MTTFAVCYVIPVDVIRKEHIITIIVIVHITFDCRCCSQSIVQSLSIRFSTHCASPSTSVKTFGAIIGFIIVQAAAAVVVVIVDIVKNILPNSSTGTAAL